MTCIHHYIVETPSAGSEYVPGQCKFCGATRDFPADIEAVWQRPGPNGRRGNRAGRPRVPRITRYCRACGTPFPVAPWEAKKKGHAVYCSNPCRQTQANMNLKGQTR